MSQALYNFLNRDYTFPAQYFIRPAQFCLHFLYGGREYANLGGVCLHGIGDKRQATLRFPEAFKSPKFTFDSLSLPVLSQQHLKQEAVDFCNSKCHCQAPEEEAKLALVDKELQVTVARWAKEFGLNQSPRGGKRAREDLGEDDDEVTSPYRPSFVIPFSSMMFFAV